MPPRRNTRNRSPSPQPEGQYNPDMAQMMELLRQHSVALSQQELLIQQQLQQQQHQQQPIIPPSVTFKTFQSVKPPEFTGTADPVEARIWLKEIEKAFVLVNLEVDRKTVFASHMLKGEALYWWESVSAMEEAEVITWDRFTELFLEKYFPRYVQNQMELKFFELKHENLSVMEYEKKFTELARFVPEYVNTDEKKAKRFQQGLKPWIRSRVAIFELGTYAGVVQKAGIVESESDYSQKERENKKRKTSTQEQGQMQGNVQNRTDRKPGFQQNRRTNF